MGLFDAMSNAVTGIAAQSYALNNISGNIANSSTAGYKSTETSFADMLAQAQGGGIQASGGVSIAARSSHALQGTVAGSQVPTNLAISGDGYFIVKDNTGAAGSPSFTGTTAYTRRGDFAPDADGYLVNGAGNYLFGSATATAPIRLPTASASAVTGLSVSSAGTLTASFGDGSTAGLGSMTLAHFGAEDSLASTDGGAFLATESSGEPTFGLTGATVTGGSVEQSNASIADQFSKMIETQQAYTANTKVLSATDEMLQDAIQMYV